MTARQARNQRRTAERQGSKTATQNGTPLEPVSLNLFEYGFPSDKLLLEGEDPAKLDQLRAGLRADHQPANITEEILVDEIAQHFWRLRRMRYFETHTMLHENMKQWLPYLPMFQRTMAAAERGMHKSLVVLTRLQKDRGFVPQNRVLHCFRYHAQRNRGNSGLTQPVSKGSNRRRVPDSGAKPSRHLFLPLPRRKVSVNSRPI